MQQGSAVEAQRKSEPLPISVSWSLLELFDTPILVSDAAGCVLLFNRGAQEFLNLQERLHGKSLNLFSDLLRMDPQVLLGQIESGRMS